MELDLLKAREFSSPNYKNDFKLPAENQKNIDDFIKKKASERKILEQRRKDRVVKMLEDMKKQEESLKNREKFLKEQTNKEKIDRIQKNIDDIQIRMVKREEDCQSWKTTLKELKKNAPIDPDKKFEATQRALLEKTTQEEMSKIKENLKPVDIQELKEFSKKHDEEIRLKKEQKLKELKDLRKQIKDNYKECRTSQFYEKAAEASQEKLSQLQKLQEFQEEKKKRAELFEKKRKEHYLPTIDEDKKEQVQNEISKLNNHKIKRLISKKRVEESAHLEEWDPAEAEILNPRAKGMEYLEYMRGLKKKETGSKSVDDLRSIEDKSGATISEAKDKKPKNYLKEVRGILAKKNDMRFLKNILNDSSISENLKRDQIKIQAAFWEEKARMKEEGLKFIGKKTDRKEKDGKKEEGMKDDIDEINELYLNSVKAKLALFQDHK